jgi:hypothetical protein
MTNTKLNKLIKSMMDYKKTKINRINLLNNK